MNHEHTDWKPTAENDMDIRIWEGEMQEHLTFDVEDGLFLIMEWEE